MAAYVFIDVSHKQEFIFKHNKLKDNLYNSFVIRSVAEATYIPEYSGVSLAGYLNEQYQSTYSVVYSGGGNSIIKFETKEEAHRFIREYSEEVLKAYPDLELYISCVDDSEVSATIDDRDRIIRSKLHAKADLLKDRRRIKFKRWTYGVEKIDETGLAERIGDDRRFEYRDKAKSYLYQKLIKQTMDKPVEIVDELKKYKRTEEGKSYIGVIVIDGNKMGEMVDRITTFQDLMDFSCTIERLYETAVIEALIEFQPIAGKLLVTPIVMAGDDICLIVHADHAIEIAVSIIMHIQRLSRREDFAPYLRRYMDPGQQELNACAGVAIAKYNYPFFEGVKTAEVLCKRAKEAIHQVKEGLGQTDTSAHASFIHWDIVQGQVLASHSYEEYVKHGGEVERFHIKPLRIGQSRPFLDGIYSYDSFKKVIEKIQMAQQNRKISKSLLEGIKKVIYSGRETYQLYFETNQTEDCRNLAQLVREEFGNDNDFALMQEQQGQSTVYTYLLNDVIHALPYFNKNREVADEFGLSN